MHICKLALYTMFESAMQPAFRGFLVVVILWGFFLGFAQRLPDVNALQSIVFLALLLYFSIASANSIVHRLQKGSVELYLSKPFSRRDFVVGTYVGISSLVLGMVVLFGLVWFLVWFLRTGSWNQTVLATCGAVIFAFASLYAFIAAGGIIFRHTSFVTLFSTLYIIFGAALLDARTFNFMRINEQQAPNVVLEVLYYSLPPLLAIHKSLRLAVLGGQMDPYPLIHSAAVSLFALIIGVLFMERQEL